MTDTTSSANDAFNENLNFIKKLWSGIGLPGMQNMGMSMPPLSLEEIDKRLQELKSVEMWLNVNVNMLHNIIQALEMQRATLVTLQTFSSNISQAMPSMNAAETATVSTEKTGAKKEYVPEQTVQENNQDFSPLLNQSAIWWNGIQEQFKQALIASLEKNAANYGAVKSATEKTAEETTAEIKVTTTQATPQTTSDLTNAKETKLSTNLETPSSIKPSKPFSDKNKSNNKSNTSSKLRKAE